MSFASRFGLRKSAVVTAIASLAMITGMVVFPASAGAATSQPDFAAQASSLGLTSAQEQSLQTRVNGYLAKMGGVQVAVNQIHLTGADLYLTLPGETHARDLSAGATGPHSVAASCSYYHMCAYQGTNFSGNILDMYACDEYFIPWTNTGSWINNQSTGTRAQFKDNTNTTRWTSPGAYSDDPNADWSWVAYVQNC